MPSWEQVSSRRDGIRQAAALLAEAVTIVARATANFKIAMTWLRTQPSSSPS
jgi:hypothetical protein